MPQFTIRFIFYATIQNTSERRHLLIHNISGYTISMPFCFNSSNTLFTFDMIKHQKLRNTMKRWIDEMFHLLIGKFYTQCSYCIRQLRISKSHQTIINKISTDVFFGVRLTQKQVEHKAKLSDILIL